VTILKIKLKVKLFISFCQYYFSKYYHIISLTVLYKDFISLLNVNIMYIF